MNLKYKNYAYIACEYGISDEFLDQVRGATKGFFGLSQKKLYARTDDKEGITPSTEMITFTLLFTLNFNASSIFGQISSFVDSLEYVRVIQIRICVVRDVVHEFTMKSR
ncbi:LOW QUALITY PROTEIN: hypothetical protein V2J09_013134 [Rumex salicifolius]